MSRWFNYFVNYFNCCNCCKIDDYTTINEEYQCESNIDNINNLIDELNYLIDELNNSKILSYLKSILNNKRYLDDEFINEEINKLEILYNFYDNTTKNILNNLKINLKNKKLTIDIITQDLIKSINLNDISPDIIEKITYSKDISSDDIEKLIKLILNNNIIKILEELIEYTDYTKNNKLLHIKLTFCKYIIQNNIIYYIMLIIDKMGSSYEDKIIKELLKELKKNIKKINIE